MNEKKKLVDEEEEEGQVAPSMDGSVSVRAPPRRHSPLHNKPVQAGALTAPGNRTNHRVNMSDMEDDFMCDDEEDYDLVFKTNTIYLSTFE